jgi:MFS family permease
VTAPQPRTPADTDAPEYSPAYVNYVLGVVMLVMIFSIVDRTITSILLVDIGRELQLSDRQLGVLVGLAFTLVYSAASLPVARWADLGVRRSIIAWGLVAWSAATALTALAQNFFQILLARMAVGIGEAAGSAPSQSLISDYVPPSRRARGLSVVSIGAVAGLALGQVAGGWLGQWYGWRFAFVAAGLPGLLIALMVRFTVREPPRGHSEGGRVETGPHQSMREVLAYMVGLPAFRWLLVAGSLSLFAAMGRNLWEPTFLIRVYEMRTGPAGTWYFLIGPLPAALGIYLGARLSDRLSRRDARWYMWIPAIGHLAGVPLQSAFVMWPEQHRLALPGGLPELPVGFLFSAAGGVLFSFFTAPVLAVTQGLVRPRMRALAAAFMTAVHGLVGHGLGPLLIGDLNERLAPVYGAHAIRYSLLVTTLLPLLASVFYLVCARTLRADLARAREPGP